MTLDRGGLRMIVESEFELILPNYLYLKRYLDLIIASTALICLSPLIIIIAFLIKWDSEGPILFKQRRVGLNSKEFMIYKFRTMLTTAPANVPTNELKSANDHITKVGKFLRKSSLDELPQLLNIIRNQMSFVGPRPVIPLEKNLVELRKKLGADKILPGVTGLAQINGRDELDYIEKSMYDYEYLRKIGLMMDLKIVFLTVKHVMMGKHISH
jgi:O-antigen biosynthesis protein WbqP